MSASATMNSKTVRCVCGVVGDAVTRAVSITSSLPSFLRHHRSPPLPLALSLLEVVEELPSIVERHRCTAGALPHWSSRYLQSN